MTDRLPMTEIKKQFLNLPYLDLAKITDSLSRHSDWRKVAAKDPTNKEYIFNLINYASMGTFELMLEDFTNRLDDLEEEIEKIRDASVKKNDSSQKSDWDHLDNYFHTNNDTPSSIDGFDVIKVVKTPEKDS